MVQITEVVNPARWIESGLKPSQIGTAKKKKKGDKICKCNKNLSDLVQNLIKICPIDTSIQFSHFVIPPACSAQQFLPAYVLQLRGIGNEFQR